MESDIYTESFYSRISKWSQSTAKIVAPLMMELIKPTTVVDVGCGDGTWLWEFKALGADKVLGLDGDYVSTEILKISPDNFIPCNLVDPPKLETNFDLALCLEVAEHLPYENSYGLVDYLTRLSDVVLFSAAIPFQPGDNHINPQWQEFWREAFERENYLPITTIREKIWNERSVPFFYKQNMILYINQNALYKNSRLLEEINLSKGSLINVVHPDLYISAINSINKKAKDQTFADTLRFHIDRRIKYLKSRIFNR